MKKTAFTYSLNAVTQRHIRVIVQSLFCFILIFIGFKFYRFVSILEAGVIPDFDRPAGVEAFLPISALVSLKHTFFTFSINTIHPSGLVLFVIICTTALIAKKSFCSWVCPFGFLAEYLNRFKEATVLKRVKMPKIIDRIFQSLKYAILGFFVWSIFFKMPIQSIEQFIHSPYNRFADIKMLKFFTEISSTALIVMVSLFLLSFAFKYFWCRYLCPYGALLSLLSFLSLGKIKRKEKQCTRCGVCETKCMGQIAIRNYDTITSPECTACLECVTHCPEQNAIDFSLLSIKKPIQKTTLALTLCMLFFIGISLAKGSGHWQNSISKKEYLMHTFKVAPPMVPMQGIDPEKLERMRQMMLKMPQTQNK